MLLKLKALQNSEMGRSLEMVVFFLDLLLPVILAEVVVDEDECSESRCMHHGPAIRFPFRLKGHQPDHCDYPGFDLYRNKKNEIVLKLPPSVKLLVKNINYTSQEIHVYDQHEYCPHFLNLSASPFPFKFNCSPINEYALSLNGSNPICENCEATGKKCRWKKKNNSTKCFDTPEPAKGASITRPVVAGAILGFFLLVLIIIALYQAHSSDKIQNDKNQLEIESFLEDYNALKPIRYSYADIESITNQFEHILGQGGFGILYKGKLSNEILVAVKIPNYSEGRHSKKFINEVDALGRIHHVNVARLVGFCADGIRRALIYEFLPNESLDKFIYSADDKKRLLCWEKLHDIAIGIAKGIWYLHQGCDQQILHFDIKPRNILLDDNFNPKISDFGLAMLCSKEQNHVSIDAAKGTMGYMAPELFIKNLGNGSHKSDVYSFGMLLLEMVGGWKNLGEIYLPVCIYDYLDLGEELQIQIEKEGDAKMAKKLAIAGLRCIQWNPVDRPSMKAVVQMLEGNGDNLTMPPNPFPSKSSTMSSGSPSSRE